MKAHILAGSILLAYHTCLVAQSTLTYLMLRDANAPVQIGIDACTADRKINFVALKNVRINGKDNLLLLPQTAATVSQDAYSKLKKQRVRDVAKLIWKDGMLMSSSSLDPSIPAVFVLPEGVPVPKRSSKAIRDYYQVTIDGESTTKQKSSFALTSVTGIYTLPASASPEEALFAFARDQKDYATWMSLLSRGGSNKITEAQEGAVQAVRACVDAALADFKNGRYGAIKTALKLADTAQKMSPSSQSVKDNINELNSAQRVVDQIISQGTAMYLTKDWDGALTKWEPVKIYQRDENARDLLEFISNYRQSLQESHNQHVEKGNQLLGQHALEPAKIQFETALSRVPNSAEAARGKREAVTLQALDESVALRASSEPRKALDKLIALMKQSEYADDQRLIMERRGASCDVAEHLFSTGRPKVAVVSNRPAPAPPRPTPPSTKKASPARAASTSPTPVAPETYGVRRISTSKDRDIFVDVRNELIEAVELCPKPEYGDLKAKVDTALSDYHVKQAETARAQQPPRPATALAHLNTALSYVPAREQEFRAIIDASRQQLVEKSKVYAGVVFSDMSPTKNCGGVAAQLTQFAQATLQSAATSGVTMVNPNEAVNLMQRRLNTQVHWVVMNGRVNACAITRGFGDDQTENVKSEYWVDDAKKFKQPYTFSRRNHNLSSQLDITYEAVESVNSGRQAGMRLTGQDSYSCEDVWNVNEDKDAHNWFTRPKNNQCQVPSLDQLMVKPIAEVQNSLASPIHEVSSKAAVVLYALAEQATDPALRKERLITFLLTAGSNVLEANSARNEVLASDKDLKFEVLH